PLPPRRNGKPANIRNSTVFSPIAAALRQAQNFEFQLFTKYSTLSDARFQAVHKNYDSSHFRSGAFRRTVLRRSRA
ncbi:hypothetical protein, partial [Sutterella wadsworthensis]|uniref:hypothetical protein n=1 Tax=Sutterella wadsworthensis TaxID=40545 RepID=UPI0025878EF0